MTRVPEERDGMLAGRYVDGEMSADERRTFEARAADDPKLAGLVRELRAVHDWFVDGPVPRPGPDFRARVLAGALGGERTPRDDDRLVRWSRRVVYAAAALIVLGVLVASGLLRPAYSGKLEASPAEVDHAMQQLDQKIATEVGRGDGR